MKESGITRIAIERREQIEKHGISLKQDAERNLRKELTQGAVALLDPVLQSPRVRLSRMPVNWDDKVCLKMCNKSYEDRLVVAGALIAAEIDRLQNMSNFKYDSDPKSEGFVDLPG